MITRPDMCPFPNCGIKVDIIYPVSTTTKRGSQLSQSSETLALSNWMGEKFNLISPILEDLIEEVEDTSIQEMKKRLFCAKCSEEITLDFLSKDTVFLSCKHVVHYDCIDNPRKKCFTCPAEDSNNPKRTAQALVNKKVWEQFPNVSDDALRKKKEWALKIYDLFSEIGKHIIQRIKSFSVSTIAKLSQDDIDHILVKFAK
ncbi:hypothetical protein RclHR1_17840004 [Rhizophagus clarus]|uniref:RING-type domain-containing protein n=1 Tax=Rhizophagus clarus TaxID=94130 RepID=A0A2Z6QKW2_9GLOM|nr:hypothetical protein RclHR1_17840004 [Rhizophagus clarus]